VHTNEERGHPVVCFGPDRVARFLDANGLSMILRAHECVMDGLCAARARPVHIRPTSRLPHSPARLLLAAARDVSSWPSRRPCSSRVRCVRSRSQRFAGGKLITVFSATNYCNRWANAGAILLVGKDLEIVPKMSARAP
jgi:protein phosphatase